MTTRQPPEQEIVVDFRFQKNEQVSTEGDDLDGTQKVEINAKLETAEVEDDGERRGTLPSKQITPHIVERKETEFNEGPTQRQSTHVSDATAEFAVKGETKNLR